MICLDSDCIIDFLKGKREAVQAVAKYKDELATTEINAFEVYFGIYQKPIMSEKEEKSANYLFSSIQVLAFDEDCSKSGAKILTSLIKEGKMIDQNDALIAAILSKNRVNSIMTKNEKHYSRIKGLNVISY